MDIKQRRPPQPPIPVEEVVPGSRWQKNRVMDAGKPPLFVIVDRVDPAAGSAYAKVHYHNEATQRRAAMWLHDFCARSEHRHPDPEPEPPIEEPPQSGERATALDDATLRDEVRATKLMVQEILTILKRRAPEQYAEFRILVDAAKREGWLK